MKYYLSDRTGKVYGYDDDVPEDEVWADIDKLEEAAKPNEKGGYSLGDYAAGLLRSTQTVGGILQKGAQGLLPAPLRPLAGPGLKLQESATEKAAGALETPEGKKYREAASKKIEGAKGIGEAVEAIKEYPQTVPMAVVESLPATIAGGAVGRGILAVTPKVGGIAAGAAGEGFISAATSIEEMEKALGRKLTAEEKGILATSGALTGLISAMGGKISQKLGIADLDTMLAEGKITPVQAGVLKRILLTPVVEGAEEGLQSPQEQAAANIVQGKPLGTGVPGATVLGVATGATMATAPALLTSKQKPAEKPQVGPEQEMEEFAKNINPAELARMEVEATVYNEDEKKFVKKPVPAKEALNTAKLDVDIFQKLLDCVRS